MSMKVLTVSLELASETAVMEAFDSRTSMLDWDLVLFRPDISDGIYAADDYQGKPGLRDMPGQ